MASLLPEGKQKYFNNQGMPMVGGKVYTYDAGTTTPRATFSDAAGLVPNPWPVVLDARGEAVIFWSGSYKVTLTDSADVQIWTVDNVEEVTPDYRTSSTGSIITPTGTTAQRDSPASTGYFRYNLTLNAFEGFDGANWNTFISSVDLAAAVAAAVTAAAATLLTYFRGYIDGLTMSTAGGSPSVTVAAGLAKDSTNTVVMTLAAPITKNTGAWTVGTAAGGLDTGVIANNTWYHWYLIRRPDTGVVDVVFSTNAATPTLPANYTQFRRIGSARTDGSAQWVRFFQVGDLFTWEDPSQAMGGGTAITAPGASRVTATMSYAPLGLRVPVQLSIKYTGATASFVESGVITDLLGTDVNPAASYYRNIYSGINPDYSAINMTILTDTAQGIGVRLFSGAAGSVAELTVMSWTDSRGQ